MNEISSRIAIVTGANNGVGFETAVGMAKAGCHVVMACRNAEKGNAAKAEIVERVPSASLDLIVLDLSDFGSVRGFVATFRERYSKLDVLINNAGILLYSAQTNADGIELQFATNHLGHFLLTALLIDMIPDDPESRIVALSSIAHKGASIHFDDLTCGGDGETAYGQSKLACLLFGDELDRRLKTAGKSLKALTVHPGGTDSGLFDGVDKERYNALKAQVGHMLHSAESAAKSSLYAALSADVAGGDYYGPDGPGEISGEVSVAVRDTNTGKLDVAQRLWSLSEEMTRRIFPI